jgi:hypothetical protein
MEALTLEEAKALSEEYQSLVDKAVWNGSEFETIDDIVVCPFKSIDRLLFFHLLEELKCPQKALAFYKKSEYDIFVLLSKVTGSGKDKYSYVSLRKFLTEAGIHSQFLCLQMSHSLERSYTNN